MLEGRWRDVGKRWISTVDLGAHLQILAGMLIEVGVRSSLLFLTEKKKRVYDCSS